MNVSGNCSAVKCSCKRKLRKVTKTTAPLPHHYCNLSQPTGSSILPAVNGTKVLTKLLQKLYRILTTLITHYVTLSFTKTKG